jgi:hypothetical protein
MLGFPGLEGDQTATLGAVAMLCMNRHNQLELVDENTMKRCKIGNMFHIASTCAAAVQCTQVRSACKSSSPTASSIALSRPGRPRLAFTHLATTRQRQSPSAGPQLR